ncbi:hypothetical protein QUF73_03880 [Cytobacillus sp. NJ13]|nr:hypothetical protein [Cytobacillus sp. NJ13]
MEEISLYLEEKEIEVKPGQSIFEAARDHHPFLPGICSSQPDLVVGVIQNCDTC